MKGEIWKAIEGFEGYYEVSNLGRFKRLERVTVAKNGYVKPYKEKILKLGYYSNGYLQFSVSMDSKRSTAIAHRLVAKAFLPNPDNLPEVNHKNGIRDDIRADNLEWCDHSYNMLHSFKELNRVPKCHVGVNNTNVKLTENDVRTIRDLFKLGNITKNELAEMYNVQNPAIHKIVTNYNWKHLL